MSLFSIGIIQGRLTPSCNRGIQFFPHENWHKEFELAHALSLNEIEWVFEYEDSKKNPLIKPSQHKNILHLIEKNKVSVFNIVADYFMLSPLFEESLIKKNISAMHDLIEAASDIGAKNIDIPFVDSSSLKSHKHEETTKKVLEKMIPQAEKLKISLSIESDFPPQKLHEFVNHFKSPIIGINYDSGNSASLGFDPEEEINTYENKIYNIHIKDRVLNGSTVPLGTGNANFKKLFQSLNKINYKNSFILQVARGKDGDEFNTTQKNITYLKTLFKKYWIPDSPSDFWNDRKENRNNI